MSGLILTAPRQREVPRPPPWLAEEAELFARKSGRTASVSFVPTLFKGETIVRGTWVVDIELKPNDPRMKLYQEGRAPKPPTEKVWLHERNPKAGQIIPETHGLREPPFIGFDIYELGASGVRRFLEKGDTWSGRGQYSSLEEARKEVSDHNASVREKVKQEAREENREWTKDQRRQRLKIPFLNIPLSFKKKTE